MKKSILIGMVVVLALIVCIGIGIYVMHGRSANNDKRSTAEGEFFKPAKDSW
jgi:flagellar basal body-associated protein FliL